MFCANYANFADRNKLQLKHEEKEGKSEEHDSRVADQLSGRRCYCCGCQRTGAVAELSGSAQRHTGMAECHQCQLPGGSHWRHHWRNAGRQVRPEGDLHLQHACLYAWRGRHHAGRQHSHALCGVPHHWYQRRRGRACLVDLYLRKQRGEEPRTQHRHIADGMGHRAHHHPHTWNSAGSAHEGCRQRGCAVSPSTERGSALWC